MSTTRASASTPEMSARIFDLFVQADHSLDRSQGGLGIGLTLVRSLVELHGGSVTVPSEGLGQGSEFVVRLPVSERVASRAGRPRLVRRPGPEALRPCSWTTTSTRRSACPGC